VHILCAVLYYVINYPVKPNILDGKTSKHCAGEMKTRRSRRPRARCVVLVGRLESVDRPLREFLPFSAHRIASRDTIEWIIFWEGGLDTVEGS